MHPSKLPPGPPSPLPLPPSLFLAHPGPLLDARSPSEHARARIPGAASLPLFPDADRAEVGTLYKSAGRERAVLLALERVGPRMSALGTAAAAVGRGLKPGERLLGVPCAVLAGGYAAYRRHVLERLADGVPLVVIAGKTGSGKSEVLRCLAARESKVLDLEGLAGHRGSAFGGLFPVPHVPLHPVPKFTDRQRAALEAAGGGVLHPAPQGEFATTEDFENRLSGEVDALLADPRPGPILAEHENRSIGRATLPAGIYASLLCAPRIVLEVPREERLRRAVDEYGGADPAALSDAVRRIARRLGGDRTADVLRMLGEGRREEAAGVLLDHYDALYARASAARRDTVDRVIEGEGWGVERWADEVGRAAGEVWAERGRGAGEAEQDMVMDARAGG